MKKKITLLILSLTSIIFHPAISQIYTDEVQVVEGMSGKVGIGISASTLPASRLHLEGQDPVLKGRGTSAGIKLHNTEYAEGIIGYGFLEHDAYGDVLLGATRNDAPSQLGFLRFYAGGSEKMVLTGDGNLQLSGSISTGYNKSFYMPGFTASWAGRPYCGFTTDYDAGSDQNFAKIVHWGLGRGGFRFYAHVNYNDTSPTFVAEISRFGTVSGASDRRLKENIHRVEGAREKIRHLEGVNYNWITDQEKTPTAGFIAQEVYEQIPEAVNKPSKEADTWTMQINPIVAYLVEAVKEMDAELEQLREENRELKASVLKLENRQVNRRQSSIDQ